MTKTSSSRGVLSELLSTGHMTLIKYSNSWPLPRREFCSIFWTTSYHVHICTHLSHLSFNCVRVLRWISLISFFPCLALLLPVLGIICLPAIPYLTHVYLWFWHFYWLPSDDVSESCYYYASGSLANGGRVAKSHLQRTQGAFHPRTLFVAIVEHLGCPQMSAVWQQQR
jgi:hypothetical protein